MNRKSPLIPMGAMTGKPDRPRMEHVLRAYKSVGIDQFLIYPRSGMEYEYMSPEWMQICRDTVEIAAELGMDIWLYDEYNWPSGNCRGQVTQDHPEFYPHVLAFERTNGEIHSKVIQNRLGADILNPDSVARFLMLTHQRYYDCFKEYFGTVVKGIFTDEPSFGYFTSNYRNTFSCTVSEDNFLLAWYDGLDEEYRALRGGNLREDGAAHMAGHTPEHFWEDYYRLVGDRMRNVFVKGMNDWCVAHGIAQTGHLMNEDAPTSVRYNGDALKMLSTFSMPGMDEIWTRTSIPSHMEWSAMFLTQYASRERRGALAELFALGPTDLPMSTMRQMIWEVSCFGVDHYVLAVAALDAKGNVEKNAYYFPTSETQPWFAYYKFLDKTAREAAVAARKPYMPTVRLRYPATMFMRMFNAPEGKLLGDIYRALLDAIAAHQIQCLYLGEHEPEYILPVLSMDEHGLFIEGEEARYTDAYAFAAHVNALYKRPCVVYNADGTETRDVLVRSYTDGSVTLVDMTTDDANDRLLTVRMGDSEGTVRLTARNAFHGTIDNMKQTMPKTLGALTLSCQQTNLLRCMYTMDSHRYTLRVKDAMQNLKFLLRHEPDCVEITLDGKPMPAEDMTDRLPDGFAPLYRATKPFALEVGEHEIVIVNKVRDHRYIPSVLLEGNFSAENNGTIRTFQAAQTLGKVVGLDDYIGTYTISAEIAIPEAENLLLAADVHLACCALRLDGEEIGARSMTPFEWEIPAKFQGGQHTLSLDITTTLASMFGDIRKLEADYGMGGLYTPFGGYEHSGLMALPVWKQF